MSNKSIISKTTGGPATVSGSVDRKPGAGHKQLVRPLANRLLQSLAGQSDKDHPPGDADTIATSLEYRRDHPATHVVFENSYRLEPQMKFDANHIERLVREIVHETFNDRHYDPADCRALCQDLSMTVLDRVKADRKAASVHRYKYIVMVSIGSIGEHPGVQVSSRSLWNATTDDFVSVEYADKTMYAIVVLYAVYYE